MLKRYSAFHNNDISTSNIIGYDIRNRELDNKYWCELSMIYDVITNNNLQSDIICFNHYRRYIIDEKSFHQMTVIGYEYNKPSRAIIDDNDYNRGIINNASINLGNYDMLVLEPFIKTNIRPLESLRDLGWISSKELELFYIVVNEHKDKDIIINTFNQYLHYCNNIMCAKKEVVIDCWLWIFNILFELEMKILENGLTPTPRMYGYIAEYLLRPYCDAHNLKVGFGKSVRL